MQTKLKFIEALNSLNLQNARVQNGDTLLAAFGKLQGQIDEQVPVFIQAEQPEVLGPYVWYQTLSQTDVREWIHDGISDLFSSGLGVLSVGSNLVLRVN